MDILSEMEEDLLTQSKNADRSIKKKKEVIEIIHTLSLVD